MIVRVAQEHPYGCQIAVCAMLLGKSYSEAIEHYHFGDPDYYKKGGLSSGFLEFILYDLGFSLRIIRPNRFMQYSDWPKVPNRRHNPWPLAPWTDVTWCEVEVYPESSKLHCIILLRDGSVLDPALQGPRKLSDYHEVHTMIGVENPHGW